jgi:hypothetical protein
MPTTLVGLLIFVALLAPGVCYNFRREGDRPLTKPDSVVRETARLVVTGLMADAIALVTFALLRLWQPRHTPEPRRLLNSPGAYFREEYGYLLLWGTALLAFSCIIATVLAALRGTEPVMRFLTRGLTRWLLDPSVKTEPAWWQMFKRHPTMACYVGCELKDGAYVAGQLFSFSPESDETPDRELTMSSPITYRPTGSDESSTLDVSAIIVSAREIKLLTVTYLKPADLEEEVEKLEHPTDQA